MRILDVLLFFLLVILSVSCNKTVEFYEKLHALPQLDLTKEFAYRRAYAIGDTMIVSGRLQPGRNFSIHIGDADAVIIQTGKVAADAATGGGLKDTIDQVKLLITAEMGAGADRSVTVSSGGYSIVGPSIEIYETGGPGSLADTLKLVNYFSAPPSAVYLYLVNGKGRVYYYSSNTIYRINNGATEPVLTSANLKDDTGAAFTIAAFYSGGVDPQEKNIFFSAFTTTGYLICRFDLSTSVLTVLNKTNLINTPPAEGAMGTMKFTANGIYPDSSGNCYFAMAAVAGERPYALGYYTANDHQLKYIFKLPLYTGSSVGSSYRTDAGGLPLSLLSNELYSMFRIMPDENSFYVFTIVSVGTNYPLHSIKRYDLQTRVMTNSLTSLTNREETAQLVGPFYTLDFTFFYNATNDINGGVNTGFNFGFLPMPGKRLALLQYNQFGTSNKPLWSMIDFDSKRIYAYSPGRAVTSGFTFSGSNISQDQLLNYDEQGHLYMTANNRSVIAKTIEK